MPVSFCQICSYLCFLTGSKSAHIDIYKTVKGCIGTLLIVPLVSPILPLFLVQNIIAEHEIRNISCAAQDPEDLCTFAYITKDLQTSHHYCHVFSTVDVVRIPSTSCPLPCVQLEAQVYLSRGELRQLIPT